MFVLDTNVVSELRRSKPHGGVLAWMRSVPDADLHLSAVTIGELQAGVEATRGRDASKASEIEAWIDRIVAAYEVLPADARVFRIWARMRIGLSADLLQDALIAATAQANGLCVATRNVRDFEPFGVSTFNPFEYRQARHSPRSASRRNSDT